MSKANFMAGMQNFALYRSYLKNQVENSKKQRESNVHGRDTQNRNNGFSRKNDCLHKFDEKNVDYLRTFLGKGPVLLFEHYMRTGNMPASVSQVKAVYNVLHLLRFMQSFGDNHWWENKNDAVAAYFQIQETTLLIRSDRFLSGVAQLLARSTEPVQPVTQRDIGMYLPEFQRTIYSNFGKVYNK